MTDQKKALLCVQGINTKQGYLFKEICSGTGKWLFDKYDGNVFDAETERFFEASNKGIFSKLANIATLNQWKRLGDVWYFFQSALSREEVCKSVGRKITMLQSQGYQVSVVAHSLGNLITMCAEDLEQDLEVENFYSLANPLFISLRPARKGFGIPGTIPYVAKHMGYFECDKMEVFWSNADFVAGKFDNEAYDLMSRISNVPPRLHWTGTGHTVVDYLKFAETQLG